MAVGGRASFRSSRTRSRRDVPDGGSGERRLRRSLRDSQPHHAAMQINFVESSPPAQDRDGSDGSARRDSPAAAGRAAPRIEREDPPVLKIQSLEKPASHTAPSTRRSRRRDPVARPALVDPIPPRAEGEVGRWLGRCLAIGLSVTTQAVDDRASTSWRPSAARRSSTDASDCVPPFFPAASRRRLYGRISCDAKGILAAQIRPRCLPARGRDPGRPVAHVARGSDGAKIGNAEANGRRFLIDGEPRAVWDWRPGMFACPARRPRGALVCELESAIDKLIDALIDLRSIELPSDPILVARTTPWGFRWRGAQRRAAVGGSRSDVSNRQRRRGDPPRRGGSNRADRARAGSRACSSRDGAGLRGRRVPVYDGHSIPERPGQLLFGPGSIHVAHTADEFISIAELLSAVAQWSITRQLLARLT